MEAAPEGPEAKTNVVALQNATADYSQEGFPVTAAIDGIVTNKIGWGVADSPGRSNRDHQAVFETQTPLGYEGGTRLKFTLNQSYGTVHTIGRFRIAVTTGPRPSRADPLSRRARQILGLCRAGNGRTSRRGNCSAFTG